MTPVIRTAVASALALACLSSIAPAAAQTSGESPWLIRARAVRIDTADKYSPAAGTPIPGDGVAVSDKWIPEVDISYFFTPNIALELILTYPQKHDVSVSALGGKVGTFKHLPPTLTAQYHLPLGHGFKPYVGAGLNYTRIMSVDLDKVPGADLDRNSFGLALQAGLDYRLDRNWSLNLDIKKVQIRSDLSLNGTRLGKVKVDPVLIGLGVGYRF